MKRTEERNGGEIKRKRTSRRRRRRRGEEGESVFMEWKVFRKLFLNVVLFVVVEVTKR